MSWADHADSLLGTCMEIFGREVEYVPAGGSGFTLQGIFDAAHLSIELHDGVEYSTVKPVLGVRLSDFATAPLVGDAVTIDTVGYQVTDVQPDGQGGASLVLRKA